MKPTENPFFRAFAVAGFASLAAIAVWGALPQTFTFEGHESRIVPPQVDESEQRARLLRASFIRTEADQITSAKRGSECRPGDVSAAEMEIILREMIRRGWQPPSRITAVADLQLSGTALFPLDPEAPMPRRYSTTPVTEDGPIPPTPVQEFEVEQPPTATTDVQPTPAFTRPAPAKPSAAELIATPQLPSH